MAPDEFKVVAIFKLKVIQGITINVIDNFVHVFVLNMEGVPDPTQISINDNRVTLIEMSFSYPYLIYSFSHQGDIKQAELNLSYADPKQGFKVNMMFNAPTITNISISMKNN